MASKRDFLSTDLETPDVEMVEPRVFEEPSVPEKPVTEEDPNIDRFGPVKLPTGDKFVRSSKKVAKGMSHVKLQTSLTHTRKRDRKAAQRAEMLDLLHPTESGGLGDQTNDAPYTQRDILKHADVQTLQKKFSLDLEMGPYTIQYDPSGRHLLLAGELGHVAMIDHLTKKPLCEFSTNEVITVMIHN
jgi:U3 small nucleolar RNA-associated protein 7